MARYRKVDPRMWGDARFRKMSQNAKFLWLYLLTGPETTSLPGVIVAGEAQLAEALNMSLEVFREAFQEVSGEAFTEGLTQGSSKGMSKGDWEARLVWIKNAIKYNKPESPNVVVSWRDHWDNVPECKLKDEIYRCLRNHVEGLGEGYAKAFRKAFGKGMPNQEQEQEQEKRGKTLRARNISQDQQKESTAPPAPSTTSPSPLISALPSKTRTKSQIEPDESRETPDPSFKPMFTLKQFKALAWQTFNAAHEHYHGAYVEVPGDKSAMAKVIGRMRVDLVAAVESNKVTVDSNGAIDAAAKKWFDMFWNRYMDNPGLLNKLNEQGHPVRSSTGDLNGFAGVPDWF